MYGKALFFVVLVVLGAVMPYILADEKWLANVESKLSRKPDAKSQDRDATVKHSPTARPNSPSPPPSRLGTMPTALGTSTPPPSNVPGPVPRTPREQPRVVGPDVPLTYLLSFQVTPAWVSENWQRVSTRLAIMNLQGWRVPVARKFGSGTFAGSITYYFDHNRFVQRIVLHGYTDDPAPFVSVATTRYQMRRIPNLVGELYVATLEQQTAGALLVQYSAVSERKSEKRCELMLEVNRQGSPYGLSRNFTKVLERARRHLELFAPHSPAPTS